MSVVIPARDAGADIEVVVKAVAAQSRRERPVEVIVADDGSLDDTSERARRAGATVVEAAAPGAPGNPARARNRGAGVCRGDPIVFLDADCVPQPGWLDALLAAHTAGYALVGGALDLPEGLPFSARCDYYCGWYLVHSRRPAGEVPHVPPPNLSVRREAFAGTSGFTEDPPFEYTNEERAWQAELRARGEAFWFTPDARVLHHNRPGLTNLLRRNYRWAYTSIAAKGRTGVARMAWLYRFPRALILLAFPLAPVHTAYILACWLRARVFEPLLMTPWILLSRVAYAAGMTVGGIRWLRRNPGGGAARGPRWR